MRCSSARVGQVGSVILSWLAAVNAVPVASTPHTLSDTPAIVNATNLDAIDNRFSFRVEYTDSKIPVTPCLMNVVELMAEYAQRDWLSRVKVRHGSVLPGYPQVEIAVIPAAPATSVEVRMVVLGLWATLSDMVSRNNFYEAEFDLLWERSVVAHLYYTKPMEAQDANSNGTSGTDVPLTLLPNPSSGAVGDTLDTLNQTQNSPALWNDETFHWIPIFPPLAQTLTVMDVFLTVIAGLKTAAPPAATDKVPGPFASAAQNVFANMQFYLHKRRAPRTQPPYFQYIHIIKALRMVPAYMLERRKFAEFFFTIDIDSITVGEGYLEKGHYVPPLFIPGDTLGPKINVSIS